MLSDHAWTKGTFYLRNLKRQKPHWKLNTNLLFVEPIHSDLEKAIDEYFLYNGNGDVSEVMVWDALKAVLRGKIIALTAAYKKEKERHREELLANIENLEFVHKQSCNPKVYRKLLEDRKKLKTLEISKIQRRILFLKHKCWLHFPKSLKLLAWKVKVRQNAAQVHAIRNKAGEKLTLTSDILQAFSDFYATLYSTFSLDLYAISKFLYEHVPHLKLLDDHAALLDEPVTPEKVQLIIKLLKNNKSPSLDGYGAEFYKAFASKLMSQLALTFNEILAAARSLCHGMMH